MTGSISSNFFVISSVFTSGIPNIVAIWQQNSAMFTSTKKLNLYIKHKTKLLFKISESSQRDFYLLQ